MTDDAQDPSVEEAASDMAPPEIDGQTGGEPEVSPQVDEAATDKGEETPDQEITTDESESSKLERLEKERKKLARINAESGERAKEAKLAALSAIAKLDSDKATAFLNENPNLKDGFSERYPDFFTEEKTEEPTNQVVPL